MKYNGKLKRYLELNNKYIKDADVCLKKWRLCPGI
ncbi:MAG: hypothetical protein SCARUB_04929 [Candidatus Scalindua rubra]|uniref:Uncharacterized protein n=1 Tax=Candidatus Scalindua rubra TaxID=1872076 RepID=A0A1E3X2W5_9BACT|nr:MAG: hypothetical protein SCARUB_04929 [Candidatus Scalindua rubra]